MSTTPERSRWVSHRHYIDRHDHDTATIRRPAGGIDGRALRAGNERDDEPSSYVCQCDAPEWVGCGPIFAAVRECARCGRPDADQLGTWPERLDLRRRPATLADGRPTQQGEPE